MIKPIGLRQPWEVAAGQALRFQAIFSTGPPKIPLRALLKYQLSDRSL